MSEGMVPSNLLPCSNLNKMCDSEKDTSRARAPISSSQTKTYKLLSSVKLATIEGTVPLTWLLCKCLEGDLIRHQKPQPPKSQWGKHLQRHQSHIQMNECSQLTERRWQSSDHIIFSNRSARFGWWAAASLQLTPTHRNIKKDNCPIDDEMDPLNVWFAKFLRQGGRKKQHQPIGLVVVVVAAQISDRFIRASDCFTRAFHRHVKSRTHSQRAICVFTTNRIGKVPIQMQYSLTQSIVNIHQCGVLFPIQNALHTRDGTKRPKQTNDNHHSFSTSNFFQSRF